MVGGVDQRQSSRRGGGLIIIIVCGWSFLIVVGWLVGDKNGWWWSFLIVGWWLVGGW